MQLVRLGIGKEAFNDFGPIDWDSIKDLAVEQGLSAIVLDGIEEFRIRGGNISMPEKRFLVCWIGETLQGENISLSQQKAAIEMAQLMYDNGIRTYVLKGAVVAECYPRSKHRISVDLDCVLRWITNNDRSNEEAWEIGNKLIEAQGYEVRRDYYKNSTFFLPGLTVENHRYLTPFRGNGRLKSLEWWLQERFEDRNNDYTDENERFEGTWLFRPPVMVSALFLIEHAYSHFLHEGLIWRMVLDWMMFSKKHCEDIDWTVLEAKVDVFGFRKFYDSFFRLGKYLIGELTVDELQRADKLMLEDIWAELDLHETVHGVKGKLALAGNTWRARWKYRYFSEDSMLKALWIQIKGFLFEKDPKLE